MTPDEPIDPDVDTSQLERSREAIDEAREAVKRVDDLENAEVGDLPSFAESTPYADRPSGASDGLDDDEDLED
jgi:hypothetical protein